MGAKNTIRITKSEQTLGEERTTSTLENVALLYEWVSPAIDADKSKRTETVPTHLHLSEVNVGLRRRRKTVIGTRAGINTRVRSGSLGHRSERSKTTKCSHERNERDELTHQYYPPYLNEITNTTEYQTLYILLFTISLSFLFNGVS
jgi:hypothetical protein